jgi:alkylhydroperoxidase family enzyme
MPRLRQVGREDTTDPVVRYMYERKYGDRDPVAEPGTETGAPGDWETVFALAPDVFEHAVRGFILYQSPTLKLDPVLRELAQTRVGWAAGSKFVFSQHAKCLRAEGASEEKVAAVPQWQVAAVFSPAERAVLAYTDCIALDHGRVPDGTFAVLREHLSDEEIVELTYITAMYLMHAVMTRALRLEFDDREDPVVEVPAPAGFDIQSLSSRVRSPMVLPSR